MIIRCYDQKKAIPAHDATILAHEVLPKHDGFSAPFESAWGYLDNPNGVLEPHSHPNDEIYIVFKGKGIVTVGDKSESVSCGDIVEIPRDVMHNIRNNSDEPLLWLAFWWR